MELDQFKDVNLVIDKANDIFIPRQFVSQGDYKGRTLTVQITNNGSIGEVPGLTLNLNWHNEASGLTDLTAFTILNKENSIFRIEYPENMMTPGKVYASIQIIQDGKVTNLKQFELIVQKLAGQPVGIVEKAEFSALVAVLADSNKFRTDIDKKADKTFVTAQLAQIDQQKASKEELSNVLDGSPRGTYATLPDLESAYPTGTAGVYIVQADGHIYSWDGTSWVDRGLYQSQGLADNVVNRTKLTDQYDAFSFVANVDLNTLVSSGTQVIDKTATNRPISGVKTGLLTIKRNVQWVHQELADIQHPSEKVYRRGRLIDGVWNWSQWEEYALGKKLAGKTVVNFGDSLFGNTQDYTSVSSRIAEKTGATVINSGFGGCQMASRPEDNWDAFSMYRLADEIVKEDSDATKWQYQDTAINNSEWADRPWYFTSTLSKLKAIDFNSVDFITIAYGTNDFTKSVPLDNDNDRQDTSTFGGALRYSLDKIMTKYPHIKILVCSQCYRFWFTKTGTVLIDSDDYSIGGNLLVDFVRKSEEIATIDFKTPFVDNYFGLGINKSNLSYYFPETDGTHHNAEGRSRLGERIGACLESVF